MTDENATMSDDNATITSDENATITSDENSTVAFDENMTIVAAAFILPDLFDNSSVRAPRLTRCFAFAPPCCSHEGMLNIHAIQVLPHEYTKKTDNITCEVTPGTSSFFGGINFGESVESNEVEIGTRLLFPSSLSF
jgi:hypothetical protein